MIHEADARLRRSSPPKTQPVAWLNRRVLLAGPAAVLCTKALRAAAHCGPKRKREFDASGHDPREGDCVSLPAA
jgi:hypothetical protein